MHCLVPAQEVYAKGRSDRISCAEMKVNCPSLSTARVIDKMSTNAASNPLGRPIRGLNSKCRRAREVDGHMVNIQRQSTYP